MSGTISKWTPSWSLAPFWCWCSSNFLRIFSRKDCYTKPSFSSCMLVLFHFLFLVAFELFSWSLTIVEFFSWSLEISPLSICLLYTSHCFPTAVMQLSSLSCHREYTISCASPLVSCWWNPVAPFLRIHNHCYNLVHRCVISTDVICYLWLD